MLRQMREVYMRIILAGLIFWYTCLVINEVVFFGRQFLHLSKKTFDRAWVERDEIRMETVKGCLLVIAGIVLNQRRRAKRHIELTPDHVDPYPGADHQVESRLDLERALSTLWSLNEVNRAAFLCGYNMFCHNNVFLGLAVFSTLT